MADEFSFVPLGEVDVEDALLVVGFPTPGFVGLVASHHLVESQDLKLAGAFAAPALADTVVLRNGLPTPPVRLYVGKQACGLDQSCDRLAVLAVDTVLDEALHRPFASALVDWAVEQKLRCAVIVEAIPMGPGAEVQGAASTKEALDLLQQHDIALIDGVSVRGLTGALLSTAAEQDFPLSVLFVEAKAEVQDAGAAAAALEVVDRLLLHIPIDAEPLKAQAETLTKRLQTETASRSGRYDATSMYG